MFLGPLYAQTEITSDDQFFEDITIGSDEDFFEISIEPSTVDEERVPKNFSMSGSFSQGVIYGIANPGGRFLREVKGVESLKSELFLQSQGRQSDNVKIKVSGVAQYEWGEWVNDEYSLGGSDIELELRDLFVDIAQESGVWIRVGNQIIARSQIDTLKITDVVNPLDLSTPGLVDFKDLRIQVPAVLLSAPVGNTNVELIAIYDGGGNKNAPLGSSFDFINIILNEQGLTGETSADEPQNKFEAVGRLNYKLNGGDLSLIIADINWDSLSPRSIEMQEDFAVIKQGYDRVKVIGLSGNLVRSNYLFKYEAALHDGRVFQTDLYTELPWSSHKQIVSGVGIEYNGITDIVLSGEISNAYIMDYDESLFDNELETGYIIQARWSGLNDILSISGAYNKLIGDDSSIYTLFIEYDVTDNLKLDGRVVLYDSSSTSDFLFPFQHQDAMKASFKYSF